MVKWLGLKRETMPHHSTYRRILAEVVAVEEFEQLISDFLSGEKSFGKQVLVPIERSAASSTTST